MGSICGKSQSANTLDTPVKSMPQFQWISAEKELHGDQIKQAAEEWCAANEGWKYEEESKHEFHEQGTSTKQTTSFKVIKVDTIVQKKNELLSSSGMPVSQQQPISQHVKETHAKPATQLATE